MNEKNKFIVGIVVILLVLGVGGFVLASNGSTDSKNSDSMTDMSSQSSASKEASTTDTKPAGDPVATTMVDIKDYAFAPATIKVKVGDKVTWTNQDSVRHDVVMDDESAEGPKSELLAKGESYSYTFNKAGTYAYHCSPHPYMKATVVVEE